MGKGELEVTEQAVPMLGVQDSNCYLDFFYLTVQLYLYVCPTLDIKNANQTFSGGELTCS